MRSPLALAQRVVLSIVALALPCTLIAQQIVSYAPAPPENPAGGEIPGVVSKTQLSPIYATMYGGNGFDELLAHVTSRDIACMVGVTTSTDLALFGPFQDANAGGSDGWIGCGNISTGLPYLASYLGSTGEEKITGADILDDTLFVVGITTSQTMPGTGGAYQDTTGGGQDCFVTRMNVHDGSGLKTTLFGRGGAEDCAGVSVDHGGVWVAGTTNMPIDLVNPLQSEMKGSLDAMVFLMSLDLNELLFSTLIGGDGRDGAVGLAVSRVSDGDSARSKFGAYTEVTLPKRVTLAGWSDDGGFPVTIDADQSAFEGGIDAFYGSFLYDEVAKLATPEYFTYAGGTGDDVPRGLSFEHGRAVLTGWTSSANWNTIGRGRIDGSSDGFVYLDDCHSDVRTPIIAYVGPSSSYNLSLAIKWLPSLDITIVGGYTAVPSKGNAFLQAFDRNFRVVGTEYTGGILPADCNTIQASPDWWVCGGKTSGPIETTSMAIQSEFHGGSFDMFGAKYMTPFSYSYLFNMTTDEITGKLNDYDLDPIAPRSPGRVDVLSWNLNYMYSLAGGGRTYQFDRLVDDLSPRISYTYLFADQSLKVDLPELNAGETGILGYNELSQSVEIYRTDQTVEHNEIKRTTVDPGQFFFIPLPKDQNFGISDGADYIEFNPKRKHRNAIRYTAGFLQPKIGKGSGAQGFELVLFETDGDPVEFPITTASAEPEEVPASILLLANHPNPFRGTTTLRFELPEVSPVRLVVYDIMGRRVRTLVDDLRSAGSTSVAWDGRNESGRPMASGTYLARLEVGGRFVTRTMVLAR